MPSFDSSWVTFASAVLVALIGLWSTRIKVRSDREVNTGPEWKSFADTLLDRVNGLNEEVKDLSADVSRLEASVRQWRQRYDTAINHVKDLRASHPNPPRVPEALADDVS